MELKDLLKYYNVKNWTLITDDAGRNTNYDVMSSCKCNICGEIQMILRHKVKRGIYTKCEKCKEIFNNIFIGSTVGRLTILKLDHIGGNYYKYYECKCECGNFTIVEFSNLISYRTTSCGCYHDTHRVTHGQSNTKLYGVYSSIKHRCYNSNDISYKNYGGRGIYVCDEWLGENGFINFYNWAIEIGCYKENIGLSIDRIDNDGPYAPYNCRFVERVIQANNTRANYFIGNSGRTIAMMAKEYGLEQAPFRTLFHYYNDDLRKTLSSYNKLVKPAYFFKKE